jgi:ShK domain-like
MVSSRTIGGRRQNQYSKLSNMVAVLKSFLWMTAFLAVVGEAAPPGSCTGTDPGSCQDAPVDSSLFGVIQEVTVVNATTSEKEKKERLGTLAVIQATSDYMAKRRIFKIKDPCRNHNEKCSYWASIGECQNNVDFMVEQCSPACLSCEKAQFKQAQLTDSTLVDKRSRGKQMAAGATEPIETDWFGVKQDTNNADAKVLKVINESIAYLEEQEVTVPDIATICTNKNKKCSYWASVGECTKNEAFMHFQCAPACKSCNKILGDIRG